MQEIPSPFQHVTGPFLEPLRTAIHRALNGLPGPLAALVLFGLKQAWSCLFGGAMLGLLIATKYLWSSDWPVHRYDALFAAAILIQAAMLAFRLETLDEVKVIFVYHVVGTIMEVFKVHVGSWAYPEASVVQIAGVPLFSGFMYGSVGSYMARVIRVFDMRFASFPARGWTFLLAAAIYLNFFLHHFTYDIRVLLFAATVLVYGRVRIHFTVGRGIYLMPLVLAAFLTSFFMWVAENVGTFTGTWVYPGQQVWHMVSLQKMGSWYLLLFISFTLVTLVVPIRRPDES